jgi:hypothetical protein
MNGQSVRLTAGKAVLWLAMIVSFLPLFGCGTLGDNHIILNDKLSAAFE